MNSQHGGPLTGCNAQAGSVGTCFFQGIASVKVNDSKTFTVNDTYNRVKLVFADAEVQSNCLTLALKVFDEPEKFTFNAEFNRTYSERKLILPLLQPVAAFQE